MLESKEYNKIKNQLKPINKSIHDENIKVSKEINKLRKELYNRLNDIYTKYNLTRYSLYADVKPMYKHFKDNIGSLECQAIADRVWSKFDKLLFGKANKVCFDRFGEYNTIENLSLIHISEPTRLLSISYAVFCLKKKNSNIHYQQSYYTEYNINLVNNS